MVCGSYGVGHTGLEGPFRRGRREGMVDGIHVLEFDLAYSNADNFIKRSWTFAKFALGSMGVALTARYDLIFATSTPLTAGIPGIVARWLRRKTFVFEVRDLWPELPRAMGVVTNPLALALLSVLEWASYRSAQRCIALAPGISKGIIKRGVLPDRVALIPNGCDLEHFRAPNTLPWRPTGVRDGDLMAIFSGTHGPANGLSTVLDAAGILKRRRRDDIRLVLVGDGKLKRSLMERATREELDNVVFHPPVDKVQLAGLLAQADLGIQCLANVPEFYYGTSPNKFFDYIAGGLPVLNNYPGWIAEMIEEHRCGFVVPPDDPDAFADALERAADDRCALKNMGMNAAELALYFSRTTLAEHWVAWVTEGKSPASSPSTS